jgi:hypothetical protein
MNINPAQLRRLQTLYGQYEAHTLDVDRGRDARLAWASAQTGRSIASFKDLTLDEAKRLTDSLQGILGVKAPSKSPRKRMSRRDAENAGTAGRRDQKHAEVVIVGAADIARIDRELQRLGWNQAGLDHFLAGARSPLRGRTQIRAQADGNKVYWALKHIPARKEPLAS